MINYLSFHVPVVPESFSGQERPVGDVRLEVLHCRHAWRARVEVVGRHLNLGTEISKYCNLYKSIDSM